MLNAIKQNGPALEFVSEELRNDKEVILEALNSDIFSIDFVGENLRCDLDFLNLIIDKFTIKVLEKSGLKDVYEDLKLKEEMKDDLIINPSKKTKIKKF